MGKTPTAAARLSQAQPLLPTAAAPPNPPQLAQDCGTGHLQGQDRALQSLAAAGAQLQCLQPQWDSPAVLTGQWAPAFIPTCAISCSLNSSACKFKTLGKKPLDFSKVLPLGRQTSAKLSQEWQSMEAEPKHPQSPAWLLHSQGL